MKTNRSSHSTKKTLQTVENLLRTDSHLYENDKLISALFEPNIVIDNKQTQGTTPSGKSQKPLIRGSQKLLENALKHKQRIDAGYQKLHTRFVNETIDFN